jgi:hypothetical protein
LWRSSHYYGHQIKFVLSVTPNLEKIGSSDNNKAFNQSGDTGQAYQNIEVFDCELMRLIQ